jgi:hypothetical protein
MLFQCTGGCGVVYKVLDKQNQVDPQPCSLETTDESNTYLVHCSHMP